MYLEVWKVFQRSRYTFQIFVRMTISIQLLRPGNVRKKHQIEFFSNLIKKFNSHTFGLNYSAKIYTLLTAKIICIFEGKLQA